MGISRIVTGSVLGAVLFFASASGADSKTCPPLQGIVLHLEETEGGYLLPVGIAGTPRLLLLDLGHAYSKLDESIAEELKLPLSKAPIVVKDEGGTYTKVVTIPSVELGAVKRRKSQMLSGAYRPSWGRANGVAGMNLFYGFDVELDLAHKRLGLYMPWDCDFQPFWPADVFGVGALRVEGTRRIVFPMRLDGQEVEADLHMTRSESVMPLKALDLLFDVKEGDKRLAPIGKDKDGDDQYLFPFKTLIGGERVKIDNPHIVIVHREGILCSGVAGRRQLKAKVFRNDWDYCYGGGDIGLGLELLKKLHLYISFNEKKVYFTAAEPVAAAPEPKSE